MTDKIVKNLNRILSLPAIYVRAGSNVLKYIGFVKNDVNHAYVPIVHYFLSKKGVRRLSRGVSDSIIDGLGKNIRRDLSTGYDLTPFSNIKGPILTNNYILYSPLNKSEYSPFDNPYDFVEEVLIENGYKKDFHSLYYP